MMSRRVVSIVALAVAVALHPAAQGQPQSAQQPPPGAPPQPQRPVFRVGIDSVSVDVVVTDKQGRPVTDLAPEDFEVKEDGAPQQIDTFKLIRAGEGAIGPTRASARASIVSLQQQQAETSRDENRLFAIFLDDYHTRRINALRVRQQLADFVRTLQPHDLVALVYPLLPMAAVTFSRDHDGTALALLNFEGRKYDYTPRNPYEERLVYQPPQVIERERNQVVMSALEGLCLYLGGMREGRKHVILVSEGFAGTLPLGVMTRGTMNPAGSALFGGTESGVDERLAQINMSDLQNQLRYVYVAASRTNTAIYTVDPRGIATSEFSIEDRVDPTADRRALNESLDTLHQLANETDGRAIVNRNDATAGLGQMLTDSSAYYLLSYLSSKAPRDGKFHRIDVKVNRKDVDVRARKGYWAFTPEDVERALAPPKPGPAADVEAALNDMVSVTDAASRRPLISWMGAVPGDGPEAQVTFVWEASGRGAGTGFDAVSKVALVATSGAGDELFRGEVPRRQDSARPAGFVRFQAPPGVVHLRLTAENERGVRLENNQIEYSVPDFTAVGPVITTPAVFRARTARDVQQVRAAEEPLPAAARSFLRSERLLLRFRAFGPGGAVPALKMELLNKQGETLVALPDPTNVSGDAFEAVVGLGSLPPGDYLFAITASVDGQTVRHLLAVHVSS
jgi:VWFA-related protein